MDWADTKLVVLPNGKRRTQVGVTCSRCKETRYKSPGPVAAKIRAGGFTGHCLPCSDNARKRDWVQLGNGRKIDPAKGYVRLGVEALAGEDRWIYDTMRGATTFVFEHRAVMARLLGRPLRRNELVDHMDGNKLNNDPANLRLYVRGKNQPGETTGYGTYYDEWQRAAARIRDLETLLAAETAR